MIFDLIPNLVASLLTVLFPIFASYKALRTADPAQLSPWLMYWVCYALITLVETNLSLLLFFVPFYSTARLLVLLYLVLPQTQGARYVYQTYIHPFLATHEARIEQGIVDAHGKLKAAGLDYVNQLIAWVARTFLGREETPRAPATYGGAESYVSGLLARFNLPTAREGLAAPASDFYGLLSSAAATIGRGVAASGGGGAAQRDAQIEALSKSGTLVPAHITDPKDRVNFLTQQRDKLRVLLGALDKEATELQTHGDTVSRPVAHARAGDSSAELARNRSETGFERIDRDEARPPATAVKDANSGGWLGWAFAGAQKAAHEHHHRHDKDHPDQDTGSSSSNNNNNSSSSSSSKAVSSGVDSK